MSQTSSTRRSYKCDPNNNNAKETLLKDTNGNVIQSWQMTKPKSLKGFNLRTTTPWISPKTKVMDDDNDFMYFSAEKVNTEDFIQSGGRANVTVNDKDIALVSHDNVVYAIQEKCPHIGGPLHLGDIEDVPGCGRV
ncbi:Rieske domain-containing protein [Orchesella cincta]|uniref:Rieske domain-containing protein n=1 Tax=Orchesella cincta TaxID=48709 RepID=A0A1D2MYD3_ORCCI|nr:Rieske domain-containing protein [Orchesella cincta]